MDLQFSQEIVLAQLAVTLVGVDPDGAGQVLANKLYLTPVLPALHVALIGGAGAERDSKTDDETENGEQQVADIQRVNEFRDASDQGRPKANDDEGNEHFWQNGAVHTHKERPL